MRSVLVVGATLVALMACTNSGQPDLASPSSTETTTLAPSTTDYQTVVLRVGQNR